MWVHVKSSGRLTRVVEAHSRVLWFCISGNRSHETRSSQIWISHVKILIYPKNSPFSLYWFMRRLIRTCNQYIVFSKFVNGCSTCVFGVCVCVCVLLTCECLIRVLTAKPLIRKTIMRTVLKRITLVRIHIHKLSYWIIRTMAVNEQVFPVILFSSQYS